MTVTFVAALCVVACKSKDAAEAGAGLFVGQGVSPPHEGFVEVTEAPKPPTEEPDEKQIDEADEADEADRAESEPAESPAWARGSSPRGGSAPSVGMQNVGTQEANVQGVRTAGGEAGAEDNDEQPRMRRVRRRLSLRSGANEPRKSAESKDDEGLIDLFGGGSRDHGDDHDDSNSNVQNANTSVQNEVTFGSRGRDRRVVERKRDKLRREAPEKPREQRAETRRERPAASATSTFSIDVDTGSYTLTGRKLARGSIPRPDEVRVEEFINFFDYDYPNPAEPFGLTIEGSPSPFRAEDNHFLVRFGVQAQRLRAENRKRQHITVLVDSSASMAGVDALPVVKRSLRLLVDGLEDADTVSVISYSDGPEFATSKTAVSDRGALLRAVESLESEGASGLEGGLGVAYRHALGESSPDTNSRILVFSDGGANIGETQAQKLAESVSEYDDSGIGLTVLGVGAEDYDDALLEQLADRGDGTYHHVNALPEARRLFGEDLDSTLYTVAEDAKIQVAFDEENVVSYRRIGYDNRALPDEFFRRDDVDAGEVGADQSVTALYEVELAPDATGRLGKLSIRYNEPFGEDGRELAAEFMATDMKASFLTATKHHRFAAALAGFAEVLKQTPLGRSLDIDALIEVADGATDGRKEREAAVYLMRRVIELAE
ncbi:MAG: YfbK domain-containing protein [Myxococcota bacterium]